MYLDYFALFLQRCEITWEFATVTPDLLPLIQTSPPLRSVTMAIRILKASRRGSVGSVTGNKSTANVVLRSYDDSIQTLRLLLQLKEAAYREDIIWSTFLLGLFEVH